MQTLTTIAELHTALEKVADKTIALVPTMGNLHQGHLSLIKKAQELADIVVVSIFVNPLQFGANEDLDKYPRTLKQDQQLLNQAKVTLLFAPSVDDIYPYGQASQTQVSVPFITENHCGKSRPGHFDGVATVVCKLLNIVQPDVAVFGQKDFQQLAVIRKMVDDLCMPIDIIGVATYRDSDGLALSSRNQYLSVTERNIAPLLYQTLVEAQKLLQQKSVSAAEATEKLVKKLEDNSFRVDYFNICDAKTLQLADKKTTDIVILVAAFLGSTRLIDNIHFSLNS